MSYFYNNLLKYNLQKDTGGGGEPDYTKIKGSFIKGYNINDTALSAGYPVYISSFDENGVINYASRRGYAREVIQTKSLVLEAAGSAYVYSYPVMTGNTSGLSYLSQNDFITKIGSMIGSKIYGSQITGYGETSILTGSVFVSGMSIAVFTGNSVEKVSYSNFFSSIDGSSFGTVTTGLTGHTPNYLFATITENSGKTIERISLTDLKKSIEKTISILNSSALSGITGVYVRVGSGTYYVTKTDFKTWLNS